MMFPRLSRILLVGGLLAGLLGCTQEPEEASTDLLQHVPAETPYVFVNIKRLPEALRERFGDHYAAQLSAQQAAFQRMRAQIQESDEAAQFAAGANQLFDVLDAVFAEFEGRDTADGMRELGIEPVSRSVFYGLGLLPALRVEIADADALDAMLDRIELRTDVQIQRAEHAGQTYRRIDLGPVDLVIAITADHLVSGLLADALFERDLPLLLGATLPERTMADSGDIEQLIERHTFTGYGEGFIKLDELLATMLGEGAPRNRELLQVLGADQIPVSTGCKEMSRQLVAGMPRMVVGVTDADDDRLTARGIWEARPAVAAYLQKLAAPVPGVGAQHDGLLAFGMGLDLPEVRNAIEALLREVNTYAGRCEWVDPAMLQAVMPQLNLALGPMTAGIKGFNLQIEDISLDPDTLQPVDLRAGLLAAVDDPRGIFAMGAMFNPALATLEVPADGSFVDLPRELTMNPNAPPVKVAMQERALLLLAGKVSEGLADSMSNAVVTSPSPLLAIDYGVHQLVQQFGGLMDTAVNNLQAQGQADVAAELRDQMNSFRVQAMAFDRLRLSVHTSNEGLVMDQVMELR